MVDGLGFVERLYFLDLLSAVRQLHEHALNYVPLREVLAPNKLLVLVVIVPYLHILVDEVHMFAQRPHGLLQLLKLGLLIFRHLLNDLLDFLELRIHVHLLLPSLQHGHQLRRKLPDLVGHLNPLVQNGVFVVNLLFALLLGCCQAFFQFAHEFVDLHVGVQFVFAHLRAFSANQDVILFSVFGHNAALRLSAN